MPEFRQPSDITIDDRGEGWTVSTLADSRHVPGMAMKARLWNIDAAAAGPEQHFDEPRERFLYVVSGAGMLELEGSAQAIGREDMVWIERGDRFRLRADAGQALVVLDAVSA